MRRIVPVPEAAQSAHAVFTASPVEPVADLEIPPVSLLRHFGATDELLDDLAARPHARVFVIESPLADAAELLAASRRDALTLAEEHDGIVVDLTVPRVVRHTADETDLTVASQWVAIDIAEDGLTTRGLEAFGMPELRVADVTPDEMPAVVGVLNGLAHRLILEWPANDPVGPATVTLRDVGRAFGDHEAEQMPTDLSVDVLIAYRDGTLHVTPVDDPASLFA